MKGKTILIIIAILLGIGLIGWIIKTVAIPSQEKKIKQLEEQIAYLKQELVPIRFKITDKTDDQIEVSVKFYDMDGNVINKQKFKLKGNVVSFDFIIVKLNDRYIAFPEKIFTNKIKPANGIEIFQYYEKDGYPMVYYSKDMDKKMREGIKTLYQMVREKNYENLQDVSGNMVQNVPEETNFRKGSIFKIVVHTKGGIEIMND